MRRDFDNKERESDSERMRRRLAERREKLEYSTRPRLSPFTLLSIVVAMFAFLIMALISRG